MQGGEGRGRGGREIRGEVEEAGEGIREGKEVWGGGGVKGRN